MGSENLDNSDSFVASVGKSVSAKLKGIMHSVLGTAKETIPIAGKGATDILAALDIVNRPTFKRGLPPKSEASNPEISELKNESVEEPQGMYEVVEEQIFDSNSEPLVAEDVKPEVEGMAIKPFVDEDETKVQIIDEAEVSDDEGDAEFLKEESTLDTPLVEEKEAEASVEKSVGEVEVSSDDFLEECSYKAPQTVETSAACAERSCISHIFDPDAYMWEEDIDEIIVESNSITETEPAHVEESLESNTQIFSEEISVEEVPAEDVKFDSSIVQMEDSVISESITEIDEPAEITYFEIDDEVEDMMKIIVPEVSVDEIEIEDSCVSEAGIESTDDYHMAFAIARTEFPLADIAIEEYVPVFSFRGKPVTEDTIVENSAEAAMIRDRVENVVADDIVNRILVDLVPEIFIEEPEVIDVLPEVLEDPTETAMIVDVIEDIVAETVVNDVMARLVPEVFEIAEKVVGNIATPVVETVSEISEDAVAEVSIDMAVKSPPKETIDVVGTTVGFMFPFATASLSGGTGFKFIMGATEDIENDTSQVDEISEMGANNYSEAIYVAPVRNGQMLTL